MSLITEKDVQGFSAVHYAAKKGDVKVRCGKMLKITHTFGLQVYDLL